MKRAEFIVGFLCSALLFGTTNAAAGLVATASDQMIFVDGRQVTMTAYNIGGSNYVKLRDIGEKVGFNVYWDGSVQVDSTATYTGEAPKKEEQKQRSAIVTLTNEVRRENGLPPLNINEVLMQAAQVRAEEMAATGTYSHTRPDGSSRTTVTDCLYTAENIHCIRVSRPKEQGVELAELAVEEWAASSGHLKNILNDRVSSIGVGLAKGMRNGGECWFCVQLFLYDGQVISWVDEPQIS